MTDSLVHIEDREDRYFRIQEEALKSAQDAERERLEQGREHLDLLREQDAAWREHLERQSRAFERIAEALERKP